MIRNPNPGRNRGIAKFAILILSIMCSTISVVFSAEPIHHFSIEKPVVIKEKQEMTLPITAKLADDRTAEKAKGKLLCRFTSSDFNKTVEIPLKNGKAVLKETFDHPMFVLITIADKSNPDVFLSDSLKISPDLPTTPKGGK